jgi:TolB-like protein
MLILGACSRAYVSPQFETVMAKNPTVAVLPFQIVFQGNPPKGMTPEDMQRIDALEQVAFQKSFFRWMGSRWRDEPVRLQSTTVTNARLEGAGIELDEVAIHSPDKLGQEVEADLVFACVVVKHRYRSDWASFGMDAANILLGGEGVWLNSQTNDVTITANLIRSSDGATLWSHTREGEAHWDYPIQQVMDNVHRRLMRQLPRD